jgi:hypothetical protein
MLSILESLEKPMALVALATTILLTMWKSTLGISWIPGIHSVCQIVRP